MHSDDLPKRIPGAGLFAFETAPGTAEGQEGDFDYPPEFGSSYVLEVLDVVPPFRKGLTGVEARKIWREAAERDAIVSTGDPAEGFSFRAKHNWGPAETRIDVLPVPDPVSGIGYASSPEILARVLRLLKSLPPEQAPRIAAA